MAFWVAYFLSIIYIILIVILFFYSQLCIEKKSNFFPWPITLYRIILDLFVWLFFIPFLEILLSVFRFNDNIFQNVSGLQSLTGYHIVLMVVSIIFILIMLAEIFLIITFYTEFSPVRDYAWSR